MRRTYLTVFIALLLVMLVDRAISQIIFYADFEPDSSEAIPDDSVNDPANYVPENAGTVWTLSDEFPGGGTALHQTAEGCDISGNTPLPGVDRFSDGLIQAVFSWQDDDSVGFQFRREGDDTGYLVSFGYNETPQIIIGNLADGCCPSGQCLDQCWCENGQNELVGVDHGFGTNLPQDNSVAYFARVEVSGSSIRVWYMKLEDVSYIFAFSDELGAPIAEYDGADDIGPGTVGIWHESWGNGRIDSVLVTGHGPCCAGVSVDPHSKLTTTWGEIKK